MTGTETRPPIPQSAIDSILTAQLAIAWAGEGGEEPRLAWWRSDLKSEFGGEDFFRRLLPNSWEWAIFQAMREAARRCDTQVRDQDHDADRILSLYCLGFEIDEHVDERLMDFKRAGTPPMDALPGLQDVVADDWKADRFAEWLEGHGSVDFTKVPAGRRLKGKAAGLARIDHRTPRGWFSAIVRVVSAATLPEARLMDLPSETVEYHTHLLRCSIDIEHSREYWRHVDDDAAEDAAERAFSEYWFGARSMPRVRLLLANFRDRFDAFPPSLQVLHGWKNIEPATRRVVCHWHLQLADRLYREFTGAYLVDRVESGRTDVSRDLVVRWVEQLAPKRWTTSTLIQFSRKLLFSAAEAGVLKGTRDPRQLQVPRVSDEALTYLLYLLREVQFDGTLTDNPYLASVGITGRELERRLRPLPAVRFRKQGDLVEFGWRYAGLAEWAEATVLKGDWQLRGIA